MLAYSHFTCAATAVALWWPLPSYGMHRRARLAVRKTTVFPNQLVSRKKLLALTSPRPLVTTGQTQGVPTFAVGDKARAAHSRRTMGTGSRFANIYCLTMTVNFTHVDCVLSSGSYSAPRNCRSVRALGPESNECRSTEYPFCPCALCFV